MRDAPTPRVHLFVCANRRQGSPLGPGCAEHGDAVYDALKREVAKRHAVADVWVTKTHCLGICPKHGATVARYEGSSGAVVEGVEPGEVDALLAERNQDEPLLREIEALEELQTKKVLDLARRLVPGLTLEDIQNPHDFPALDDTDWHYADGVLSGIKSVKSALLASRGMRDRRG